MSNRARQLADRIDEGAATLAAFARGLSDTQWNQTVSPDGRTVGVIVHHVASIYPIEMGVVREAMKGAPITEVTWDVVANINAEHARANAAATKAEALKLLARNSADVSEAVRGLSDAELDVCIPFSLSYDAPVTVQYVIEDHPLRHPWHHMARIRKALNMPKSAPN